MPFPQLLKTLRSSPFVRMNIVFFAGSMVVAFLNYLYYPLLGRLLPTSTFGELQVIVSAFMQTTIILNVLSMISISILISQKNSASARTVVSELEKISVYLGIFVLVAIAVVAEPLRQALKFESIYPFIAIAVVFVITIPLTFRNAELKAKQDFVGTSIAGAIGAVAKLIFSYILVLFALKTFGAVLGIAAAQIVALVYTNLRARRIGYHHIKTAHKKPDFKLLKPYLPYASFVLAVSLITTLQVSMDVTVVKFFFDPQQAGNYSAVATISRIIFFAISSIVAVLLSSIDVSDTTKNHWHVFKKSLALTAAVGGSITLIFCLFPTFIMHLLMGARYDVLTHLLPLISISTLLASLVTLQSTYHIALRDFRSLIPVAAGFIVTIVLILMRHSTIDLVVLDILFGSTLMFIFVSFFTAIAHRSSYSVRRK